MSETVAPALIDLRSDGDAPSVEARIIAATRRCVARWGVAKTTLDDIAREAGCSRATVYRAFPGGKDVVLDATWLSEFTSFCAGLETVLAAAGTLEDVIVIAISESCHEIATHDALQFLLAHEPGAVLPFVAFDGLDPLLLWAREFAVPFLGRFVGDSAARDLGEWVARLVVSYGFEPVDGLDLADPAVARDFVRTFILPAVDFLTPTDPERQIPHD